MINKLSEDNFESKLDIFLCMMDGVPHLADNTSEFNGLTKHNLITRATSTTIIWSPRNPHFAVNSDCQVPCVMVWCGIRSTGIVGPMFIDGNLKGEKYFDLLSQHVSFYL